MKALRGLHIIECEAKACVRRYKDNVVPECMGCEKSVTKVFDLDGSLIYEYRQPEKEVKPAKAKGGNKK